VDPESVFAARLYGRSNDNNCVGKCQIEQRQKTIRTTKQVHL